MPAQRPAPPEADTLDRPCLAPGLSCWAVPSVGLFLASARGQFLVPGELAVRLAPLLDGRHSIDDILAATAGGVEPWELFRALDFLRQRGYVTDARESLLPPGQSAYWQALGLEPAMVARHLASARVSLRCFGAVDAEALQGALAAADLKPVAVGDWTLVVADDYLDPQLEAANRDPVLARTRRLVVRLADTTLWLGPLLGPGTDGCWDCLRHRLQGHRQLDAYLASQAAGWHRLGHRAQIPGVGQAAHGLIIQEMLRCIADPEGARLRGRVISIDIASLQTSEHVLTRRPQCPTCGIPRSEVATHARPPDLRAARKRYVGDGGHRTCPPSETVTRLAPHVSPITGIVAHVRKTAFAADRDGLIQSYVAEHAFPVPTSLHQLRENLGGRSAGKGRSEEQAKASAISEAIERYCGVFVGDEPRIRRRFDELGPAAVHPNRCMLFSERQIAERPSEAGDRPAAQWVAAPFDEHAAIEWSPLWSLTHDATRYLPTAYCYYGYAQRHGVEFAQADSNGCGAGNNSAEAIVQGFLEVVERDAVAIWWYNRIRRPEVDLASFGDAYFDALVELHANLGRRLCVLDITTDLEIPAFAAVSWCTDGGVDRVALGFGAHFDAHLAISRAVTELNQLLPAAHLCDAGGDIGRLVPAGWRHWWQKETTGTQPQLVPSPASVKARRDYPKAPGRADLADDVRACVDVASRAGLEVLVLDQSRPDIDFNVVKVVVPGLRHMWPRFAPGRLYEVPPRLGWRAMQSAEADLNPTAMFF